MLEIINIIFIGIALSMDAFSIALSIGTLPLKKQQRLTISGIVGLFHLFMPLFGLFLGNHVISIFHINAHILMAGILLLVAFEMLKSAFETIERDFNISLLEIIGIAFTVSIDSFSTGIGLGALTNHVFLSAIIFASLSSTITYFGLFLGEKSKVILGKYAVIGGAILLIIIALVHFAL